MKTIDVTFESLEELPVARLFGAVGVYVLWAPNAGDRPTYIGEGTVLQRINDHVAWLTSGVTGIVASLHSKREAEIVEAVLLWTGDAINRRPSQNTSDGKWRRIDRLMDRHTTLRLNVRGSHPFVHPNSKYSELPSRAEVTVRLGRDGNYVLEHPWNRRST